MAFHLEQQAAEYQAAGMTPAAARQAARRAFGGVAQRQEECRDQRRVGWIEDLGRDLAYALRGLRKAPGFTAVAVATLALAIGANTAIFSVVHAVMLESLPVQHPEQLVMLDWNAQRQPTRYSESSYGNCPNYSERAHNLPAGCTFSYPLFRQIRESGIFANVFAGGGSPRVAVSVRGRAALATADLVSGDFFPTLGVRPLLGRMFG
ncbi:MAG: permease prefix domain 1-containing protein, partial [Gammaproteobacteria bacterium]